MEVRGGPAPPLPFPVRRTGEGPKIVLSDGFVSRVSADFEACFPIDIVTGFRTFPFGASFTVRNNKEGVTGLYHVVAFGTDGVTKVGYQFELTGTVSGAPFAPVTITGTVEIKGDPVT